MNSLKNTGMTSHNEIMREKGRERQRQRQRQRDKEREHALNPQALVL